MQLWGVSLLAALGDSRSGVASCTLDTSVHDAATKRPATFVWTRFLGLEFAWGLLLVLVLGFLHKEVVLPATPSEVCRFMGRHIITQLPIVSVELQRLQLVRTCTTRHVRAAV